MISVDEALTRILAGLPNTPTPIETVAIDQAYGRILATDLVARVSQPPGAVSAMDGWAVRARDASVGARLIEIGAIPAGRIFSTPIGPGEATRIFTGAILPPGADAILIQEDATVEELGDRAIVSVVEAPVAGRYVRPAGLDFTAGQSALPAGRRLSPRDIGLAAAMNHPWIPVRRRPRVAILPTGDEIVRPGEPIAPGQIVSSNALALAAMIRAAGGDPVQLDIAADRPEALRAIAAGAAGCDLLVTTGGASVGAHDHVREGLVPSGFRLDFWQIAMRPGKPLIYGRMGDVPLLGLPGNPVSSLVCALLFLKPAIDKLLGLPAGPAPLQPARLGRDLGANDRRQDYLRATLSRDADGALRATPFDRQDSSMMAPLATADCLLVRAPLAAAARVGDPVEILRLDENPVI